MDIFIKTLETADGRDKFTKTAQYFDKVILWLLTFPKSNAHALTLKEKLERAAKLLSDSRKIFRLMNWLPQVRRLRRGPSTDYPTLPFQIADMLNAFGAMASSFCDDTGFLIKIWNGKPTELTAKIEIVTNLFWTLSVVAEVIMNFTKMQDNYLKEKQLEQSGSGTKMMFSVQLCTCCHSVPLWCIYATGTQLNRKHHC